MRNRYIVAYDVRNPRRLRRTFSKMNGFGDRLQYSLFVCDLTVNELAELESDLLGIVNVAEDSVLIVDIGRVKGRAAGAIRTLGQQNYPDGKVEALVV